MGRWVLLDAGPLGLLTHPAASTPIDAWVDRRMVAGDQVVVPEIADYEVRRELLRGRFLAGITLLDGLTTGLEYLPITTWDMRTAARLWAAARQRGRPTADDRSLDGDVILAAQALGVAATGRDVVVATSNRRHLERYVPAQAWEDIG